MKYTLFFYGTIHKMSPHQNAINLSPKGEFLRTHRVGPLGLSGSLSLVLLLCILTPYEPCQLFSGWWWWVGGIKNGFFVNFF